MKIIILFKHQQCLLVRAGTDPQPIGNTQLITQDLPIQKSSYIIMQGRFEHSLADLLDRAIALKSA